MKKDLLAEEAPLVAELIRYSSNPLGKYHMPGHKAGSGLESFWHEPGLIGRFDLTEISAFAWEKSLKKAEELAAEFYQADQSFFLVQGATQGILAAVLGAFRPGDRVLVGRNCHITTIHALILAELKPIFIEVDFLPEWNIATGIKLEALKQAIDSFAQCKGLIVTTPTYQGLAFYLPKFRQIIGERILIVDEAHGGYFSWMGKRGYDAWGVADLWIQGTHKMLGSLTQTGILHIKQKRVEPQQIQQALNLITTTSPSYLLLASLDSNRRFLATKGAYLFAKNYDLVYTLKRKLHDLPELQVLDDPFFENSAIIVDPWKITLSFAKLGLGGFEIEALLKKNFQIQPEYADINQVNFLLAPWQTEAEFQQLYLAIKQIILTNLKILPKISQSPPQLPNSLPQGALDLREVYYKQEKRLVPLSQARGRICGEVVAPYPPGIPLICPGEIIGLAEIDYLEATIKGGGLVRGITAEGEISVLND